jgi:hypothetical protein
MSVKYKPTMKIAWRTIPPETIIGAPREQKVYLLVGKGSKAWRFLVEEGRTLEETVDLLGENERGIDKSELRRALQGLVAYLVKRGFLEESRLDRQT